MREGVFNDNPIVIVIESINYDNFVLKLYENCC